LTERLEKNKNAPYSIDYLPRQWVISVGKAAGLAIREKYGIEPSNDLIKNYIEEARGKFEDNHMLRRRANLMIWSEFHNRLQQYEIQEGLPHRVAIKKTKSELKKLYQKIEKDNSKNYSFLDELILGRLDESIPTR